MLPFIDTQLSLCKFIITNKKKYNRNDIELNNAYFKIYDKLQNSKEKLKKLLIKYELELKEVESESDYDRYYHYNIDTIDVDNKILILKEKILIIKKLFEKYDIVINEYDILINEYEIENDEKIIYI